MFEPLQASRKQNGPFSESSALSPQQQDIRLRNHSSPPRIFLFFSSPHIPKYEAAQGYRLLCPSPYPADTSSDGAIRRQHPIFTGDIILFLKIMQQ